MAVLPPPMTAQRGPGRAGRPRATCSRYSRPGSSRLSPGIPIAWPSQAPVATTTASWDAFRSSRPDPLAQRRPGAELDAQGFQARHLGVDHRLGQAILGDAVAQQAARPLPLLVHHHLVARAPQVVGGRQAGRAGSHHRHPLPGGPLRAGQAEAPGGVPQVALQRPNGERAVVRVPVAGGLAEVGAHPAGDGGERVAQGEDLVGLPQAALGEQVEVARHRHCRRAGVGARRPPLLRHRAHVAPLPGEQHAPAGPQRYRDLRVAVDVGEVAHRPIIPEAPARRPRWPPPGSPRP